MTSPLHPYPGSSHMHNIHQSPPANAVPGSLAGLLSPPESRRTSGDEKDAHRLAARQSLPSISEALRTDQTLPYPGPAPPSSAVLTPSSQHYAPTSTNTSPSSARRRPGETDAYSAHGPSKSFPHPRSPFVSASTLQAPPPPPPPSSLSHSEPVSRSSYESHPPYPTPQHNPRLPSLHPIKTTQSPPQSAARPNAPYSSYPPAAPAPYESSAPQPNEAATRQYGHSQYASYPPSAPAQTAPPAAYPPPASTYSAPRYYPTSLRDNAEVARLEEKKLNRSSLAPYGESVKRHLDSFDLEASLNEVRFKLAPLAHAC